MSGTLFEIDDPPPDPLALTFKGYALAHEIGKPITKCDEAYQPRWHLDTESFRETLDELRIYELEWGDDEKMIVVAVEMRVTEIVEPWHGFGESDF